MAKRSKKSRKETPLKQLAETELEVLKELWDAGEATVRDLHSRLTKAGRDWAYTTVQTLLQRLEQKGYVEIRKDHVPHVFVPALSWNQVLDRHLDDMANKLCDGRATPLVLTLVQNQKFSAEDIQRFRELLDEMESAEG